MSSKELRLRAQADRNILAARASIAFHQSLVCRRRRLGLFHDAEEAESAVMLLQGTLKIFTAARSALDRPKPGAGRSMPGPSMKGGGAG